MKKFIVWEKNEKFFSGYHQVTAKNLRSAHSLFGFYLARTTNVELSDLSDLKFDGLEQRLFPATDFVIIK